ncbi:MAG: hypothetical protein ACFE8C_14865, partial [Promethearchaeota archaeon]
MINSSGEKINNTKVRIREEFKEDAGRGIIRLDPELVEDLGLKVGDIIEIFHPSRGKKTAALLSTGRDEDRGKMIIRLDPSERRNIDAAIDEFVVIRKIEAKLADTITFTEFNQSFLIRDSQQLARILEKRVIMKGDNLSFYAMGHRVDLVIVDYSPNAEAVKIHLDTKINFIDKKEKMLKEELSSAIRYEYITELEEEMQKFHEGITYEDIGGLKDEI